ncbi:MAG: glycosyltransferase [Dorea sp.]|nr:glycosyltransferase [Dorea sp.]
MKKIAIYAETGKSVGLGHLIRCSAIAEELCRKCSITFITPEAANIEAFQIKNARYMQVISPVVNDEAFVFGLKKLFEKENVRIALLDSYYITQNILLELNKVCKIIVFDGNHRYPLGINMVINYTLKASCKNYAQRYGGMVSLAIGPKFFPLRSNFRLVPPIKIEKKVKDIFVSLGGSGVSAEAVKLFSLIEEIDENLNIYAVGGEELHELDVIKKDSKIHFYSNIKNIEEVMTKCDIAVSAAGTTLYELLFLGIPVISFAVAENQLVNKELEDILLWCGLIDMAAVDKRQWDRSKEIIENKLRFLLESYEARKKMSERGKRFIDGLGAERIAELIEKLEDRK